MVCLRCGCNLYGTTDNINNDRLCSQCRNPNLPSTQLQGWVCPKCGAGLSPFINRCLCVSPIKYE